LPSRLAAEATSQGGLDKRRRLTPRTTSGAERAEARLADREIRSYESEYVNGLWHWDCHHGSRKVLTARGEWATPILFGVIDDRSRLACHLHCRRGLPRRHQAMGIWPSRRRSSRMGYRRRSRSAACRDRS